MMSAIIAKAEGFGEVVRAEKHDMGYVLLLIRRSDPAFPNLPYMTILGFISTSVGRVCLELGHYDLAPDDANIDFEERLG